MKQYNDANRGSRKRSSNIRLFLAELPYHIQVMVMIAMCLGLRISEIRASQWQDFDLKGRILTLTRSIVGR